jgi:hypothetical protein
VDRVHERWTTARSCSPHGAGRGGVLVGVWPPTTLGHGSSPERAQKRGECGELASGLTGAQATVWRPGDGNEAAVEGGLSSDGVRAPRKRESRGVGCAENWQGVSSFYRGRRAVGEAVVKLQRST